MLAFSAGDHGLVANLARAVAENVEGAARMTGEWKDHQSPTSVTNNVAILAMPGVANVISGITAALARFPEARHQVIQYLRTADDPPHARPLDPIASKQYSPTEAAFDTLGEWRFSPVEPFAVRRDY